LTAAFEMPAKDSLISTRPTESFCFLRKNNTQNVQDDETDLYRRRLMNV
jgi:hypothetical protein